jgi:cystathionine beta-lyase/cystathionine gamma-synthase
MTESEPRRGDDTRAVHGPARPPGAMSAPVVRSATFSFESLADLMREQERGPKGSYYQRLGHPTLRATEERLADLEGAEQALLFPSGMAAISAVFLSLLQTGDHVVALHQSYGGTRALFNWGAERLGWRVDLVDGGSPETWEAAFRAETKLFHVESPTNPTLTVVDLRRAANLAHARGVTLTVDNTFASPLGQHPLTMGADLVVYSATKSIGGHSDLLGGVVAGPAATIRNVWRVRTVFGAAADPEAAWLIERSLKTLALRVERQNANALALARRLGAHAAVKRVHYPGLETHPGHALARAQMQHGFGPVLAFELKGGDAGIEPFLEGLTVFRHAPSLGSVESLASSPIHTSHIHLKPSERAAAGVPEGLVRLAVGIENEVDLWADLERALARVAVPT